MWAWISLAALAVVANSAAGAGAGAARLLCYVENASTDQFSECTHLVYAGNARGDKLEAVLKDYRKNNPRIKIVLRVTDGDKDLRALLKTKHVQGLEVYNAHRSLNRTRVQTLVSDARAALSSAGSGPLLLSLPAHAELLAKYYDLRELVKVADLMVLETEALGLEKKMTYHPSRLSGVWDMMNTDSVVDLAVGLGVPASKLVISLPATARQFTLVNETLSTPGSPTEEEEPKVIDQAELCRLLQKGRWTLERDQDLSGPYAFQNKTWISFEDSSSVDVKGKYARVRGLAGLALKQADRDAETPCGATIKAALAKVLNQQSRAPRALVLRSLEQEILAAPHGALEALQVSPYRITQVVDSDGLIHSVREDTRTEFSCTRQGYFVHPRSCGRFYRCVKFDQLSPEYTVFEFDCPSGLAFDSRYEVCVWPGSLPDASACAGSSEIAPVPRTRFVCPDHEGYYADPENCRWFFACLDHGTSPLSAYEFRCPFGLGFDADRLKCDWPWLVPNCGNVGRYEAQAHGFNSAVLTGASGYHGQTAEAVNVAAHQSLASGAALNNLVGIQGGYLSQADALDANFIASQEYHSGGVSALGAGQAYQIGHGNGGVQTNALAYQTAQAGGIGLVQPTKYSDEGKYTSGSLLLDDYRLPTGQSNAGYVQKAAGFGAQYNNGYNGAVGSNSYSTSSLSSSNYDHNKGIQYQATASGYSDTDNSGAYVHDTTGDHAEPYRHEDAPAVLYIHDGAAYKDYNDYQESRRYKESSQGDYAGKYVHDTSGQYDSESGNYNGQLGASYNTKYSDNSGKYNADYSGSYNGDYSSQINTAGKYVAGIYQNAGQSNLYSASNIGNVGSASQGISSSNIQQYHGSYAGGNSGQYLTDGKAYTGASHTLAAGSVNVGLVGKTTLVDAAYEGNSHSNYQNYETQNAYSTASQSQSYNGYDVAHQSLQNGQLGYISQPAVSINHVGTDSHNLDGYIYHTTPTASLAPTTARPIAVTTALPAVTTTYKTTYVPAAPTTSIKQIFGISQPVVTYVQPTVIPVKQYVTPSIEVTGYNQAVDYQSFENKQNVNNYNAEASVAKSESLGYDYSKPSIKFEEGVSTYSTPAPAVQVSTYQPQSFNQQTVHNVESVHFGYSTPAPAIAEAVKPSVEVTGYNQAVDYQSYENKQIVNNYNTNTKESDGYDYPKPSVKFEGVSTFSTPAPAVQVSTFQPQSYNQQTVHNVESVHFGYSTPAPALAVEEPFKKVVAYTVGPQPVAFAQPTEETYAPQSFSSQTIHQTNAAKVDFGVQNYHQNRVEVAYEQPKAFVQYSTVQPAIAVQSGVSEYQPQVYSQQTVHNVDTSQVQIKSEEASGYDYPKPAAKFEEAPKLIEVSTARPEVTVSSTYKPQSYSQQTIHKVESETYFPVSSTVQPKVELQYQQPSVSVYDNPILKYTQKITPVSYVKPVEVTQTYQPIVQQHEVKHHISQPIQYESVQQNYNTVNLQDYSYSQPEIQRESFKSGIKYSLASDVSHQIINHGIVNNQYNAKKEDVVFVSSTPSTLAYEEHYSEYEAPKKIETYQAPEYVPPKNNYQESYTVSTASTPVIQKVQSYQPAEYVPAKNDYQETYSVSSTSPPAVQNYRSQEYVPQRQTYKAAEYAAPKIVYEESYTASPIVHQQISAVQDQYDYKQQDYSQQYEYSQKIAPVQQNSFATSYVKQPKTVESFHISSYPASSVTVKPISYQSPEIQVGYNAEEYLPPVVTTARPVTTTYAPRTYSTTTTREYLPPTSESNNDREYLPPKVDNTYIPPSTTSRPVYKSTRPSTTYKYVESTTFQAPEYLPPQEDEDSNVNFQSFGLRNNPYQEYTVNKAEAPRITSTIVPVTRKPNLVVETAKANLLGFGTVGPDAGLVSTDYVSSTESYPSITQKVVTSTYPPAIKQGLVEINPRPVPARRTKPKVAVVTKINDFNPLLVRKLGAVCSCQSPVVVLKGRRPSVQVQDYDVDYSNDYDDAGRGDIGSEDIVRTSYKESRPARIKSVTVSPIPTSTFNPIIVPDDSYYQDISGPNDYSVDITPKNQEVYSDSYVSSTPAVYSSTTEKVYTIRPRVKAVTVAPTYRTVLLKKPQSTPAIVVKDSQESHASTVDSATFDRYGPGGLRSRDETLQGSVDCQRAGLFRHPKQCNKFYACRWDCTKQRFTLHVFNCPVQLTFDASIGACNWPSQGPACQGDTLLTNTL
ncbi:unnamed protein product [Plutella xylostella]|uniref:(diamondback moth) hypothetical protein n=1 Tax=Plutella xylostella TaxID=51655 RepID=A0A8S4D873_PLUXY|nr:unnamed protein product [Plutella xylostella]